MQTKNLCSVENKGKTAFAGIIFDYGEVMCLRPEPSEVKQMAEISGIPPEDFILRYERDRTSYDRGDLSPEDYWTALLQTKNNGNTAQIQRLRQIDVQMWSHANRVMVQWVDKLHSAGFKTALLSNMHPDMAAKVRHSWLPHFDVLVLSCELRLAKPEAAIYEECVRRLGIPAHKALFVDDRQANIDGARKAGLAALRFTSPEELTEILKKDRFPVLPI